MVKPEFKDGKSVIVDYANRKIELPKYTWNHIIKERKRSYFERFFDKVARTLKEPTQVRESTKEKNIVIYQRFFDDFYISNTVLGRAYVEVVVNWKTKRIRTVYMSRKKRQKGKLLWPVKK